MKKYFLYGLVVLLLCGCNPNLDMVGMFYGQSPRSDVRFATSMEYNDVAGFKTIVVADDSYKVYVCSDVHVDSTARNIKHWATLMRNDTLCELGLILGDMINAQHNFPRFMEAIAFDRESQSNDVPLFGTPGNHDLYFGQWAEYISYWHTSSYYFTVETPNAKDFYISLDTGDGTFGRKQLAWLREVLAEKTKENDYRHIIVFTHTHIFKRDVSQGHTSNFPMEETYEVTSLFQQYGVELYLSGHAHSRNVMSFKDVRYVIVDTMQDAVDNPYYLTAMVAEDIDLSFEAL